MAKFKYPGKKITTNGNQLVAKTEAKISQCGVFYPITPSTEQGENFEMQVAHGGLTVFGEKVKAIEAEGEHAAQGGAIAMSVTGKRVSNFTSGQGIIYGLEQYYHAPGKLSTMVLNVGARALTKHALNVHCGHDDIYAAMDTGWAMFMAKDAQQAVDQSVILRKVTELALTPGMNIQDGFLTTHLERTFCEPEAELLRVYLGKADDLIDCPNDFQKELFGEKRKRVPDMYNLKTPLLLGSVQNQEHYMTGVISRRCAFNDYILKYTEECMQEFGELTGRHYGLISQYNCTDADTVFVALGSAAENIEAAVDYIQEKHRHTVGVVHINVIRPFPEKAIVKALAGRKNVIILERTDEPNSGANPIGRDIRTALFKALQNGQITRAEIPILIDGVYGLGSRDFRPEHALGAYEYAQGKSARQDGQKVNEGDNFLYLGVNHPYAIVSEDKPSLLPASAISVRIHSIGGWGAITTGKNMAEIIGNLSSISKYHTDEHSQVMHISANPKYGSEKKGAPTNYFLVAAREKIRVNCDLLHVDVVLCCDPKIFTHTNPLKGLRPGGAFIWESESNAQEVWQRIPPKYRHEIIDNKIKLYTLCGFKIARTLSPNESLQTRMQGNSFLGAFFSVSTFLQDHGISKENFLETVLHQYKKKFSKLGDDVVASNLEVMKEGFEYVQEINYGKIEAKDESTLTGAVIKPADPCQACFSQEITEAAPIYQYTNYKSEFLTGNLEQQVASALTSTGIIPAKTGEKISKYVSRMKTPVYDPYKCTQCMACINICPDTALFNTVQNVETYIGKIFKHYISNSEDKNLLCEKIDSITDELRASMNNELLDKIDPVTPLHELLDKQLEKLTISAPTRQEISAIMHTLPLGYGKTKLSFQMMEKQAAGSGGLFSIFVTDHCKGCAECVDACGPHEALQMQSETSELRAQHLTATEYFKQLPSTPHKYLGKYNIDNIEETRDAILHNHLLVQENYSAMVSGDGACAGCGEKSVLRGLASITEALMRPTFREKAGRLEKCIRDIKFNGVACLDEIQEKSPLSYKNILYSICHLIMDLGAEDLASSQARIEKEFTGDNHDLIQALILVMQTDANNHKDFHIIEGKFQGMAAMGMTASTGCNTVYGSTHPANPHSYPWMNSLFQDGATIGWLVAESFMLDHAKRSVLPERIANLILQKVHNFSAEDYENLIHFDDAQMTEREVRELPKVWAVGGDGAFGDIGFQNVSKVVLQNRPNLQIIMLDTQVYSNTGGQNSDSSLMPGGYDMNQYGKHHEGKLTERKEVAQIFTSGHGSPFVACVSMGNIAKFYRALIDGLLYRGTCFIQSFTTCQPEHGVADNMSATQALRVRDARGVIEFIYDPAKGELNSETFDVTSNPRSARDWQTKKDGAGNLFDYNIPQWAATEGRFKKHFIKLAPAEEIISLEEAILRLNQNDITYRHFLLKNHRAYLPTKGIYVDVVLPDGKKNRFGVSRQMALFTVERRKNWRRMQSTNNIKNIDYLAQSKMLRDFDAGEIDHKSFFQDTRKIFEDYLLAIHNDQKEPMN